MCPQLGEIVIGRDVGQRSHIECVAKCMLNDVCFKVSFLPQGGSSRLGTCVLQLTFGGKKMQQSDTTKWQQFNMGGHDGLCN